MTAAEMIDEKRLFISRIQDLLLSDPRSDVKTLSYSARMNKGHIAEERIQIEFTDGGIKDICATGNSNGANLKAIARAVYGAY